MNVNKKILVCIIFISLVQMATNGISSILGNIQEYYSDYPTFLTQFLMTFPSLFIVIFTLLSAYLLKYFSKKVLIECGLTLVIVAGIVSFFGYTSIYILFLGAALLGMGVGMCASFAISLISDYFVPESRSKIVGIQTASSNIGSMIMTFVGGLLAVLGWHYNYLVYFIAIPGLILSHFWLDNKKEEASQSGNVKECKYSFKLSLIIIVFMILFYIGPTSIALLLIEKGFENPVLAGTGATMFLLGGALASILFAYLNKIFKNYCIMMGFIVLSLGFLVMNVTDYLAIIYIGLFIAGTSISFVMPRCMLLISTHEKKENVALATAIGMSASNVGILIAPIFTIVTGWFNVELTSVRITIAIGLSLFIAIIGIFIIFLGGRKNEKSCSN